IWKRLTRDAQFSESAIVVEVSPIKILGGREVGFTGVRTETKRNKDRRFCQRQTFGRMIIAEVVKTVMSMRELAIRFEKRRVMHDSLIQKIGRIQQICSSANIRACHQKKILGATVKVESGEISGWLSLNGQSLSSCDFGLKVLSDSLRDLTLDSEHVVQIAIVLLRPKMRVRPRID